MKKIKTGDDVVIIAGKDKGRRGRVIKMHGEEHALVEGVNIVRKHVKRNPQKNENGGIRDREAPIHLSNLGLYNETNKKACKVGFKFLEDGKKVRYFKSTGEVIDV